MTTTTTKKYWHGSDPAYDDWGLPVTDQFIDGRTAFGPWGIMTPESWRMHGCGKLGTGYGQRYQRQDDGRWLKVEG